MLSAVLKHENDKVRVYVRRKVSIIRQFNFLFLCFCGFMPDVCTTSLTDSQLNFYISW